MINGYFDTKKNREEWERRVRLYNLYRQSQDDRNRRDLTRSALLRSALQAQKDERDRIAKAEEEQRKWRETLLDDKNYTRLKRIVSGVGYNDAIQDIPRVNEFGEETLTVNPALVRIAGTLGKIPGLSQENVYENAARIARMELPDFYDSEKIRNMILPIANEVKPENPIAILNEFNRDPDLLADFQVAKGIMPNKQALLYAINEQKIRKERQRPAPQNRSDAGIPEKAVRNAVREFEKRNPGRKISQRDALNFPEVAGTDPEKYRKLFLRTPSMAAHVREKQREKRREEEALGMSDARFNEIKAKTQAANRERKETGEVRYLTALNEYLKNPDRNGNAPDRGEYMVNAMNLGRTIPNTNPEYQYYTPNAAALAKEKFLYNSPEFFPGLQKTAEEKILAGIPELAAYSEPAPQIPETPVRPETPARPERPIRTETPARPETPVRPDRPIRKASGPLLSGMNLPPEPETPIRQSNEADIAERLRMRKDAIEAEKRRLQEEDRKNRINLYLTGGF